MNDEHGAELSPDSARGSSWGGPAVRAELRRIADEIGRWAAFRVCSIDVLRGGGLVEQVAFTGGGPGEGTGTGQSFSLKDVQQVMREGARYGTFVFLAEEDMDVDLQRALRSHGYVPPALSSTDPERWRPLDMLVAGLTDTSGRTRAFLHLDEPLSGRRPGPDELHGIAARLELLLQAVLVTVDREELTRRARLDETARATVRAASRRLARSELLAQIHPELMSGFSARSVAVQLYDAPKERATGEAVPADIPPHLRRAVEEATRRAWASRTVIIAEPGRVWGDDLLQRDHSKDLTNHLAAHSAGELLLVPVGAGHELMGVLVVVRDGRADRWTEGESQAALGVGHDLGRALLSTRAHEREQQLIDELQRLDEYRMQLIATVSHELKNPLGLVVGHIDLLDGTPGLPPEAAMSVAALGRGASRLVSLVDDLLLLSRISHFDGPTAGVQVDLGAVLTQVTEDESLGARQLDVTLQIAPADGPLSVAGEPDQLHRVVANLVNNAVKFSRPGGTVHLSLEGRVADIVFVCADRGIGISDEDQKHLFTEFFRSTNPQALQRPGTGLGLAIAKRIVDRHGGHIEVETEAGVGTTFRVTLPREHTRSTT